MAKQVNETDEFSSEEAARRRDEVIRRMANTPPQPKVTPKAKAAKEPAEGRGLSRTPRGRTGSAKPSAQE